MSDTIAFSYKYLFTFLTTKKVLRNCGNLKTLKIKYV